MDWRCHFPVVFLMLMHLWRKREKKAKKKKGEKEKEKRQKEGRRTKKKFKSFLYVIFVVFLLITYLHVWLLLKKKEKTKGGKKNFVAIFYFHLVFRSKSRSLKNQGKRRSTLNSCPGYFPDQSSET